MEAHTDPCSSDTTAKGVCLLWWVAAILSVSGSSQGWSRWAEVSDWDWEGKAHSTLARRVWHHTRHLLVVHLSCFVSSSCRLSSGRTEVQPRGFHWGDGQTKRVRSIVIVAGTERWSELHHELIPSWSAPSIQLLSCGLDRISFLPFPTLEPMCRGF